MLEYPIVLNYTRNDYKWLSVGTRARREGLVRVSTSERGLR